MLGHLLQSDLEDLIARQSWEELRRAIGGLTDQDLAEVIIDLPAEDEGIVFRLLPRDRAAQVFSYLPVEHQTELVGSLSNDQTRDLLERMTPDDRVSLLDELPHEVTRQLLESLSPETAHATRTLLGYPSDTAGHSMTPEYVSLRPDMTAAEAIDLIRRSTRRTETFATLYVVDADGKLVNDLRLATLVRADPSSRVGDLATGAVVAIPARTPREEVVRLFEKYDRSALAVTDDRGAMVGIITADDVLDASRQEATEDMQKLGGLEAIDTPYATTSFVTLWRKRAGWLSVLFLGEMLTATAMSRYEDEIARTVVLALFVPLIISSGGNSGSQAATLIVRSLALSELTLRDWWKVAFRELASGLTLGIWLGLIGFVRVLVWQHFGWADYGAHHLRLAFAIWLSLVGVVGFGSFAGSMLPFVLRAVKLDPATSSAPFVATLVDVTGLVIYFTVAAIVLGEVMR
ncbi:MAG: magnesium transporter [Phycisphaerales bacterium]